MNSNSILWQPSLTGNPMLRLLPTRSPPSSHLPDFYHRRLRPADEIETLSLVANAPPIAAEKFTPTMQQRAWRSFERIFRIIQSQGLPKDVSIAQYHVGSLAILKSNRSMRVFFNFWLLKKNT